MYHIFRYPSLILFVMMLKMKVTNSFCVHGKNMTSSWSTTFILCDWMSRNALKHLKNSWCFSWNVLIVVHLFTVVTLLLCTWWKKSLTILEGGSASLQDPPKHLLQYSVSFSQGCGCWRLWLWQVGLRSCQGAEQGGSGPVCQRSHHHCCSQRPTGQAD